MLEPIAAPPGAPWGLRARSLSPPRAPRAVSPQRLMVVPMLSPRRAPAPWQPQILQPAPGFYPVTSPALQPLSPAQSVPAQLPVPSPVPAQPVPIQPVPLQTLVQSVSSPCMAQGPPVLISPRGAPPQGPLLGPLVPGNQPSSPERAWRAAPPPLACGAPCAEPVAVGQVGSPQNPHRLMQSNGSAPLIHSIYSPRPEANVNYLAASHESLAQQIKALQAQRTAVEIAQPEKPLNLQEALRRWPSPESPESIEQLLRQEELELSEVPEADADSVSAEPEEQQLEPEEPELPVSTEHVLPALPAQERVKATSALTSSSSSRAKRNASRARRLTMMPEFQEEAARCRAQLQKASLNVSAKHLRELRQLRRPPRQVAQILDTVALLLGEKCGNKGYNWQKMLSDSLPQRLSDFDVAADKEDITKIHALITGPFDTPYEGGFFYFLIRCPPDYPIRPPRVKLMTTGGGQVRFNPNLYRNGKVCLSILGTWSGPAWSPAQSLSSVLISIQSLLNEKPYHNEPGFEQERQSGDSKRYNECIQHESLRVAVCDMLEGKLKCPSALKDVMEKSFPEFYDYYLSVINDNSHQNGQSMMDPFGEKRGTFDFVCIKQRLEAIKKKLEDKKTTAHGSDASSSDNENIEES